MSLNASLASIVLVIFVIGTATTPSASAAPPDDACSLLTPAQVGAVLGVPVVPGTHLNSTDSKSCMWSQANAPAMGRKSVAISLNTAEVYKNSKAVMERTQAAMKEEKDEDAGQLTITPVTGIGDEAYYGSMGTHPKLNVKKGNLSFSIEIFGDFPPDKSKAMEKTLAVQILSKI
jgi:hypothetical protein